MERKYYVYVWYRKSDNKPFYVGKGQNNRHTFLHNRNNYFMNMYKKHGGYVEKIRENLTEIEAFQLEVTLIREYKKQFNMTNITDGGEGTSGLIHSKETREKLSLISKKQWSDPIMRRKLSESRRKTHSNLEFRKKMSITKSGKKISDEHRLKIKAAMRRPEVVQKVSESHIKYRDIICTDKATNETKYFNNTREAANWLIESNKTEKKKCIPSIIKCLNGERKSAYGCYWSFAKES